MKTSSASRANDNSFRCGYVTIVGRPNVGKSTLLNRLIGQKLSITTRKPQTTRHHLLGIKNHPHSQALYIDTPGFQNSPKTAINRYMNREVINSIGDVDVLIFLIEALKWTDIDQLVLKRIQNKTASIILAINKIDKIANKQEILPFIEKIKQHFKFADVIPMSALSSDDIEHMESIVVKNLPVANAVYKGDQISNRNPHFFAAEFIREKLTQKLGDELPYQLAVTIDDFKEEEQLIRIQATIWVERPGQKGIVIGKNGSLLKSVGEQSRKDMEVMFDQKVHLETWVKVKGKWTDDERALKQFNFDI